MTTDIRTENIVFRITPPACHPYLKLARVDRPIGTWLLLLPCWWGLAMANAGAPLLTAQNALYALLFALGAFVMRGAGCAINDLWDRKLDAAVERTRIRPLPAGDMTVRQALGFLAALLLAGLAVLLCFNGFTVLLGVLSLALVVTYPLMKRVTWWPQLFLGFTFNWGVLMGWTAIDAELSAPALAAYAGGIFWTLAYDTIYAHQDKEDDALAGIKSTARLFAGKSRIAVAVFFALALLCLVAAKYLLAGASAGLWLFALPALHAAWQVKNWQMDAPASSLAVFRSNRFFGGLVLLAFVF